MKDISRYLAIGISLLLMAIVFYYFSDIVAYVLIAWVLSMVGQPLMRSYQKLKVGKYKAGPTIAAVLTLITFFVFSALLIAMFIPLIVEQARNLSSVNYNEVAKALEVPLNQLNKWLLDKNLILPGQSPSTQIHETLQKWFAPSQIGNIFGSIVGVFSNFIITIFSVVFITFFFLKEQGLFVRIISALVPTEYEGNVVHAIKEISRLLTRYFGGILLQVTIITLFVSLCLSLLGIKNALLIGFFAAMINVIPYIGPLIGASFGVFITISSNLGLDFYLEMLPLLLKVVATFGAMQMLDNFFVQPFIFSNSVLAHPLEIFIIVLVGAKLGGISGMVLAIPAYTVLRVIAKAFFKEVKLVQRLTDGLD